MYLYVDRVNFWLYFVATVLYMYILKIVRFFQNMVRHSREVSKPDCCKAVLGSNTGREPLKMKVHTAVDELPICRTSPKFVEEQCNGSESTKKKTTKYCYVAGSIPAVMPRYSTKRK